MAIGLGTNWVPLLIFSFSLSGTGYMLMIMQPLKVVDDVDDPAVPGRLDRRLSVLAGIRIGIAIEMTST